MILFNIDDFLFNLVHSFHYIVKMTITKCRYFHVIILKTINILNENAIFLEGVIDKYVIYLTKCNKCIKNSITVRKWQSIYKNTDLYGLIISNLFYRLWMLISEVQDASTEATAILNRNTHISIIKKYSTIITGKWRASRSNIINFYK